MKSKHPFVSVIVPVYKDEGGLGLCVKSLLDQSYPTNRYEVIVVDNGLNPGISHALPADSRVRLIEEKRPGSYAARNAGIKISHGDVLAFIDADIEADTNWIAQGVTALAGRDGIGLVGGAIEFTFRAQGTPNLVELCDSLMHFDQKNYIEKFRYSVTGNLFTYRAVVDAVGPFDPELRSGGDREWGNRVDRHGYELVYAPAAFVHHPARSDMTQLIAKARRVSGRHLARWNSRAKLRSFAAIVPVLIRGVFPPLSQMREAARRHTGPVWPLVQVMGVLTLLKYVRTAEILRLSLGGEPRRE